MNSVDMNHKKVNILYLRTSRVLSKQRIYKESIGTRLNNNVYNINEDDKLQNG